KSSIPGFSCDGGYAGAMVAPADALALTPAELSPVDAAPLLRASVTAGRDEREKQSRAGHQAAPQRSNYNIGSNWQWTSNSETEALFGSISAVSTRWAMSSGWLIS